VADQELVERLRQGGDVWNAWQSGNDSSVDLSGADLSFAVLPGAVLRAADLSFANLDGAELHGANLSYAKLSRANLHDANLTDASLTGANLNGADLHDASLTGAKLSGANLSGAKLSFAELSGADLSGADLSGADPSYAKLIGANLSYAKLIGANLSGALLHGVDLSGADLSGADLSEANITFAKMQKTRLLGAKLTDTVLEETIFADTDLRSVIGLETCVHKGPSSIDFFTLKNSHPLPLVFLRGIGLPDNVIEYLPSLVGQAIQYYSCFISYSSMDDDFARRIHADLQGKGVRCWFAPHDLSIGAKIMDGIDEAVRSRDKLLLVLSEHAIRSDWVEDEVKTAFEEERRRGQTVLFPIRLDDAVLDTKEAWAGKLRMDRHIGDFRTWKDHDSYQESLKRVLRDLKNATPNT
jgi:uncharacterized protein YjbI with pentapeptide repeats